MAKELYLYSPIYSFVAESVLSQLEENMDNDVTLKVLTPGGSVFAAYGIYDKVKEHGNVLGKFIVADSAGAFLPLYCKDSECLNVSRFTFHRADMFVENDQEQEFLNGVNKDLRVQMLKKIDPDIWKEVTGITIDELFDSKTRIDVTLTATQAKKVGLINRIVNLTPQIEKELAAFNSKIFNVAANATPQNKPKNNHNMTIDTLKAEHPALFAQVVALGVEKEKDRVESIIAFIEIDPVACKEAIALGKDLTQKQMSEFAIKAFSKDTLEAIKNASAKDTPTGESDNVAKTEKAKEIEAFEKSLDAHLNINKTV